MRLWYFIVIAMIVAGGGTATAEAEWIKDHTNFELEPKMLTGDGASDIAPAIAFDLGLNLFPTSSYQQADVSLKGTLATDENLNKDQIEAKASLGVLWVPGEPGVDPVVKGSDPDADSRQAKWFGYIGSFSFDGNAAYETDQSFDEQNIVACLEAAYLNTSTEEFWSLIPSVYVGFDYVDPTASEVHDELDVEKDAYVRYRVEASLKCEFGQWLRDGFWQSWGRGPTTGTGAPRTWTTL